MKTLAYAASLMLLLFWFQGCTKKNDGKQGYIYTEAFKNNLSAAVEIRTGVVWPRAAPNKDTIVYSDTIKIAAKSTVEKSRFICTANCYPPGVMVDFAVVIPVAKIIAAGKERSDSSCQALARFSGKQTVNCNELYSGPNIYDTRQRTETKDGRGNTIRSEYVFDEKDLASFH
ncbi:MAG: hypothetical protein J7539_05810 [Niabella sp.]|nr:hypothetical protein [Niabella sp.]